MLLTAGRLSSSEDASLCTLKTLSAKALRAPLSLPQRPSADPLACLRWSPLSLAEFAGTRVSFTTILHEPMVVEEVEQVFRIS